MADIPLAWILFALGGLLVLLVALVIRLLFVQAKGEETAKLRLEQQERTTLEYMEEMLQDVEARRAADGARDLTLLQNLLHDGAQSTAQRVDALGLRLDQSGSIQEERFRGIANVLNERLTANDEKMERMRETLYQGVTRLQQENAQKLEEMRQTVDEKLQTTLNRRLGESFQQVSEQLEQVYKGLGEMQSLAAGVGDLKRVLTNVKTRGTWGEVQLGTLLEEMLAPGQFERNVGVRPTGGERVDYAILLPGREEGHTVYLPIDAKFPMEPYERLQSAQEAGEKEQVEQAVRALGAAIRTEGQRIATKYIVPPFTVDFALMYLPSEGLYAQVLQVPGLVEGLQRQRRVVVAGPTTLSALLNSLQMGFRTLAIEKRSGEVWQLLSVVKGEFGRFLSILERTQQRLRQASDTIDEAARKTRTIERKLRDVESIDQQAQIPSLTELDEEEL